MFDSRTDAPRKAKPVLHTKTMSVYEWEGEDLTVSYVPVTSAVRFPTKRQARKEDTGSLPVRPTVAKGVALYEAFMDLIDLADERAIAGDGVLRDEDMNRMYCDDYGPYIAVFDADGAVAYRTETPPTIKGVHAPKRAKGVRFPDLDPYTLEPLPRYTPHVSEGVKVSGIRPRSRRYF